MPCGPWIQRQSDSVVLARARIVAGLAMSALLLARLNLAEALATLEAAEGQVRQWLPADWPVS